jgi:aryl-alcohol dehydrogenase-like predicted oxidoreductase
VSNPGFSGPAISGPRIVLGGNTFGWTTDEQASFAVLDAYVDGGGVMIDTADVYSAWIPGNKGGESETIIGAWMKSRGKREQVKVHTKVGMLPGGLQPDTIAAACDASLKRLGIEQIDLYYAHRDDQEVSQAAVAEAFEKLFAAGKIASLGASNFTADRLQSALDNGTPYTVLQPEYNMATRGKTADHIRANRAPPTEFRPYDAPLQQLCVERGISVLPYFGLASGFLTGKYRSADDLHGSRAYRVRDYMTDESLAMLTVMDGISAETGAPLTHIALAWLNAQPGIAAPLASASGVAQVEDLLAASRFSLTEDQLRRLD